MWLHARQNEEYVFCVLKLLVSAKYKKKGSTEEFAGIIADLCQQTRKRGERK